MASAFDQRHMRRALELASRHHPHPNPRVGSVVVADTGEVIGEGFHEGPGQSHAEIVALEAAGERAKGSTIYVSLEPCAHHGLTPPCVDVIIAAGVRRVLIGAVDPDVRVSGKGKAKLQDAGVEVVDGLLADEARATDPAYFHHRETGLPLVTLKYAMTLDGSAAAIDRSSQWISSDEAREDSHRLRAAADAVAVGAGTLRRDDPRLDVRLGNYEGHQPRPVVIAGTEPLPEKAVIWERNPLVVATDEVDVPSGIMVAVAGDGGLPDPRATCLALAELGYIDILLEGGPTLAGAWWRAGVISRGVAYLGAKMGGGGGMQPVGGVFETIEEAAPAKIVAVRSLGADLRIDFERV